LTTIVVDRRVRVMVADSKLTISFPGLKREDIQARTTKIRQYGAVMVGASGESPWTEQILKWARTKRTKALKFPREAKVEGLILFEQRIWHIDECGEPIELDQDFFAIGSGAHSAMGAMLAGASPIEAVEIACKVDPHSELPVQVLKYTDGQ